MSPIQRIAAAVLEVLGPRTGPHEFGPDGLTKVVVGCTCQECVWLRRREQIERGR